jgi:hypothetical protein
MQRTAPAHAGAVLYGQCAGFATDMYAMPGLPTSCPATGSTARVRAAPVARSRSRSQVVAYGVFEGGVGKQGFDLVDGACCPQRVQQSGGGVRVVEGDVVDRPGGQGFGLVDGACRP